MKRGGVAISSSVRFYDDAAARPQHGISKIANTDIITSNKNGGKYFR